MNELVSDPKDILSRLRLEERQRAEAIRLWRANSCAGSIRTDDHNAHW